MCRTDVRSLVTLDQILYEIVSWEGVHISVDGWQFGCRAEKLIKILIYCNKLYQKYSTILNSNNKAFFSIFVFFCWMLICILYWRILRLWDSKQADGSKLHSFSFFHTWRLHYGTKVNAICNKYTSLEVNQSKYIPAHPFPFIATVFKACEALKRLLPLLPFQT